MKLILFGPPGVGKGTVGKLLEQTYDLPLISMGDLIREEIKKETDFGKRAKGLTEKGVYVPDEEIINFLIPHIQRKELQDGFILDGFPRTMDQAKALDQAEIEFTAAIELEAPEEVLVERLSTRRTCRKCARIFNVKTIPPKIEGVCDDCSGELYQREDQKPEVIQERLNIYKEKTVPLIDYYKNKKILLKVSAEPVPDKILQDIMILLKNVYP